MELSEYYHKKYQKYKIKYLNLKGGSDKLNALIVEQFNQLITRIKAEQLNALLENNPKEAETQAYRIKQTKRILAVILRLDFEIKSENDLKGIPGIGAGTLFRIKEILETGKVSDIEHKYSKKRQKQINSIRELLKVVGVGETLARRLIIDYNISNVKEFKKAVEQGRIRVSRQVKLGLKYYDKFQKSIPRSEMKQIEKYLSLEAKKIDPNLFIILCGSYRRGRLVSGDIDVLLYNPNVKHYREIYNLEETGQKSYLELLIAKLTAEGFLLDYLSMNKMKYMGFCKYKEHPVRRIDFLWMPYNNLPAAMLYFTGPADLNEQMRSRAKKRNMLLDEFGLYIIDSKGHHFPVPVHSEKDIFEELDMQYLTPKDRELYS